MIATYIGNLLCILVAVALVALAIVGAVAKIIENWRDILIFIGVCVGLVVLVCMMGRGFTLIGGFISAWS